MKVDSVVVGKLAGGAAAPGTSEIAFVVVRHAGNSTDWRDTARTQRYTPRSPNRLDFHE